MARQQRLGQARTDRVVEPAPPAANQTQPSRAARATGRQSGRQAAVQPAAVQPAAVQPAAAQPAAAQPAAAQTGREPAAAQPAPAAPGTGSSENAAAGRGVPEVLRQRPAPAPRPAASPEAPGRGKAEIEALAAQNRSKAAACGDLEALRAAVADCTACGLCEGRTQTVFADGSGRARVMFIGEGPGFHEDRAGVPFVGKAGALLTDIITKGMKLPREDVYIANVVKCRPPDNRDPSPEEKAICTPWLDRQVELVDPAVLIPLGRHAAGHVLQSRASMSSMRNQLHEVGGRKVIPTFHPAYLLRSPGQKKACWEDIQRAMVELGLPR